MSDGATFSTARNQPRPWNVGEALRTARSGQGMSLRELSEATRVADPEKKGVLPAQISRIENGSTPDLRELLLLSEVLGVSPEKILKPDVIPWFVVRRERAEKLLTEIESGQVKVERLHDRHQHMMNKSIYKYVPLEDNLSAKEEYEGNLTAGMRAYIFEVARASQQDLLAGLDRHHGEEIVIVMEGELEFWFKQRTKDTPRSISLKAGDCIHYSSQLLHGYRAAGKDQSARAIFVFSEPDHLTPPQVTADTLYEKEQEP